MGHKAYHSPLDKEEACGSVVMDNMNQSTDHS